MKLIVAVDENWGIGYQGKLLQMIPEDMKFFKDKTINKVIVMGRNTFDSLPNREPLKDRVNIVLSRSGTRIHSDAKVCTSLDELFSLLKEYRQEDIFIIGGEDVYRQLLSCCKTAYITKQQTAFKADKYMVNLDKEPDWKLKYQSEEKEFNGIGFTFNTYIKE